MPKTLAELFVEMFKQHTRTQGAFLYLFSLSKDCDRGELDGSLWIKLEDGSIVERDWRYEFKAR